jgi:hypothetical protein
MSPVLALGACGKDCALGDDQARRADGRDENHRHHTRVGRDPLALEDPARDHAPDETERDVPSPPVTPALHDEPGHQASQHGHEHPHDEIHDLSPFMGYGSAA